MSCACRGASRTSSSRLICKFCFISALIRRFSASTEARSSRSNSSRFSTSSRPITTASTVNQAMTPPAMPQAAATGPEGEQIAAPAPAPPSTEPPLNSPLAAAFAATLAATFLATVLLMTFSEIAPATVVAAAAGAVTFTRAMASCVARRIASPRSTEFDAALIRLPSSRS